MCFIYQFIEMHVYNICNCLHKGTGPQTCLQIRAERRFKTKVDTHGNDQAHTHLGITFPWTISDTIYMLMYVFVLAGMHDVCMTSYSNNLTVHMILFVLPAELRLESVNLGGYVRISSAYNQNYLCFNKRGRLTVRVSDANLLCLSVQLCL